MRAVARRLVFILVSLAGATRLAAQARPAIAALVPSSPDAAHVFVLDSAHILSSAAIAALQDSSRALQTETGADVAWVTLPTLHGRAVEEVALYIGRTWHIGTPGKPGDPMRNRGLVVLYVPDKTTTAGPNFRIEVGKGLEGTITDSRSRSITTAMRGGLKAKTYDEAYMAGWAAAASLVREDFAARVVTAGPDSARAGAPVDSHGRRGALAVVVFVGLLGAVVVVVVVVVAIVALRRRRGTRVPRAGGSTIAGDRRRWRAAAAADGGMIASTSSDRSSSSDSDSSSSSSGGDFGGGGGFSGGGSSDSI